MTNNPHEDAFVSTSPFEASRIRAAAIYCSDGRYGDQVDEFLHHGLNLPRYDRLAIPGGSASLAGHFATFREEEGLLEQLRFLVRVHELERVVLIAHQDCAFYTHWMHVSQAELEQQQFADLLAAAQRVQQFGRHLTIETYFARRQQDRVRFEQIDPTTPLANPPAALGLTL